MKSHNIYNYNLTFHFLRIIYVFLFHCQVDGDDRNLQLNLKCLKSLFHNTHSKNLTYFKFIWLIGCYLARSFSKMLHNLFICAIKWLIYTSIETALCHNQGFIKAIYLITILLKIPLQKLRLPVKPKNNYTIQNQILTVKFCNH